MSTQLDDGLIPSQLVDQLAKGYDALACEMKSVHEYQRQLENQLAWAKQQVRLATFIFSFLRDDTISSRS
jgi:hypothetical protein